MTRRRLTSLAAASLMTLAIAGCGDEESESGSGGAETTPATQAETTAGATSEAEIQIAADPSGALKFNTTALDARAGKVTIVMDNPSDVPHAVSIRGGGQDVDGETVQKGGKSTASAELKAGKYEFYCPVPGHEQGGMKGELTVK